MFIDEKDNLRELVEKRLDIKSKIEAYRNEVKEKEEVMQKINEEVAGIQKSHGELHKDFEQVNNQINKMVLMDIWDKLEETKVPKEIVIKDDKIYCEVIDLLEDIKSQAKENKEIWRKHLEEKGV
jgi:hypothetical protein